MVKNAKTDKQVRFSSEEITVVEEISKKMSPVWQKRHKEFSKKAKEIFWKGAEVYSEELNVALPLHHSLTDFVSASEIPTDS